MNKRFVIIIGAITLLVLGVSSLFVYLNRSTDPASTGGSGVAEKGSLILRGYETKTNGSTKISLGTYLTTQQERSIRHFLEAQLFKVKQKEEYIGNVVPGTVEVDHKQSVVTFKVRIEDPKVTYTISYNTLKDALQVTDESGRILTP